MYCIALLCIALFFILRSMRDCCGCRGQSGSKGLDQVDWIYISVSKDPLSNIDGLWPFCP